MAIHPTAEAVGFLAKLIITKKMKESEVKVGTPVWYHPTIDEPEREAAVITSNVWNVGSTPCCKIDIRSGCVAIEALELR